MNLAIQAEDAIVAVFVGRDVLATTAESMGRALFGLERAPAWVYLCGLQNMRPYLKTDLEWEVKKHAGLDLSVM